MAKMFPARIEGRAHSQSEERIFRKIQTETPDSWFAIHSLGLTCHARKPWAEIDFLLLSDHGVFCLEVKGGSVRREGTIWFTGDRELHESPFQQAGGASAALYQWLKPKLPSLRESVVGFGVVFPDVCFPQDGPDIDPELVYDDDD